MTETIYKDALRAVRVLLAGGVSSVSGRVDYSLPENPVLPFVRVELENTLTDPSDNRYATARIRADVFAHSDYEARMVASEVRSAILPPDMPVGGYFGNPEPSNPGGARILGAGVQSGPYPLPDPADLDVYRLLLSVPYM